MLDFYFFLLYETSDNQITFLTLIGSNLLLNRKRTRRSGSQKHYLLFTERTLLVFIFLSKTMSNTAWSGVTKEKQIFKVEK